MREQALPRHVVVVGALVRNGDGAVLLIRHPKRGWEIPQGKVEEGEDLVEALHREILEETGVEIDPGPLAAVYSKISPPPALVFNFLAHYRSGSPRTSEESLEVGWFPEEEALGKVSNPVNADRLRALVAYSGTLVYRSYTPSPYLVHAETTFAAPEPPASASSTDDQVPLPQSNRSLGRKSSL